MWILGNNRSIRKYGNKAVTNHKVAIDTILDAVKEDIYTDNLDLNDFSGANAWDRGVEMIDFHHIIETIGCVSLVWEKISLVRKLCV
jgi:hypothetical protein